MKEQKGRFIITRCYVDFYRSPYTHRSNASELTRLWKITKIRKQNTISDRLPPIYQPPMHPLKKLFPSKKSHSHFIWLFVYLKYRNLKYFCCILQ